ncbi:4a-hydroxytetrahydrobiopterin dehydratase [Thalassobacillus pellis]|uniref:4a-hydroxytetrahydrobiopterin dehydratase n=1 Tax=Thalassobacillus pellis TaxID=748008 RepID=UPI0019617DE4|nr:4a-hydroxytetrahydrobiopterin dehydratase [Thalassobacillus pellis]MBM7553726.1 4a-hydroxytetrahydrobiopterin dehydratase [Thalassobacillus pellis]
MERLTSEQIDQEVALLKDWKIEEEKWIVKRYRFKDYLNGIQFVNRIAEFSEEIQHHPFISIDYKMVTLKLTSWSAKGLTDLDMRCAAKYDQIYEEVLK